MSGSDNVDNEGFNYNSQLLSSSNNLTEGQHCNESDLAKSSSIEEEASTSRGPSSTSIEDLNLNISQEIVEKDGSSCEQEQDKSKPSEVKKSLSLSSSNCERRPRKRLTKERQITKSAQKIDANNNDNRRDNDKYNLDDCTDDNNNKVRPATSSNYQLQKVCATEKNNPKWQHKFTDNKNKKKEQQVSSSSSSLPPPMLRSRLHLVKRGSKRTCGATNGDSEDIGYKPTIGNAKVIVDDDKNDYDEDDDDGEQESLDYHRLCGGGGCIHSISHLWPDGLDKSVTKNKSNLIIDKNLDDNNNNLFDSRQENSQCSLAADREYFQRSRKNSTTITNLDQCSEFGSPPFFGLVNLLKYILNFNFGFHQKKERERKLETVTDSDSGDNYNSSNLIDNNKYRKLSALNLHEWQRQKQNHSLLFATTSNNLDTSLTSSSGNTNYFQQQNNQIDCNNNNNSDDDDMPNNQTTSNNNYGGNGNNRYQSFDSVIDQENNRQRRTSNLRRSSRDPYGYLRLSSSQYYDRKLSRKSSICQEFKRVLLLLIIVAICGVILWQIYEVLLDEDTNYLGVVRQSPSELGKYYNYAVSTDALPCAKVGKSLLAKGGHAVDAAIGTLICMGVVLPNSLGLGGGCLMTIYNNISKQAIIIDGREQAPDYAHDTMFSSANPLAASRGPLSVGIPGELAAYWEAHKRFGRLKWAELFGESIRMAEEGSPTVEHLAYALRAPSHSKYITEPLKKVLWNNKTNDYVAEGDLLRQPALANTLKRIRDNGMDEFYRGPTGFLFIEDLQKQGGKMTMDNLSKYKALVKNATFINIENSLKVYTQPVPGSGIVLSIILRIMNELGYYQNEKPKQSLESASLYYHHLTEAYKFAYAQRAALEDQPDDQVRMEKLVAQLESNEFIKKVVSKIENDKTLPIAEYGGLSYFQEDHGTAHVSIIDSEGNAIAVTTSINLYFGSGLVSPTTGIIYNDVMDDFVATNVTNKFGLFPSKYNHIKAGRRPISSMAPSVIVDANGNPKLVIGASGGSKITTSIATVLVRNQFLNEDIKTAIDGSRIHHQYLPDKLSFEGNFPPELLGTLASRGHNLEKITGRSSVVMAVACDYLNNGTLKLLTANSDYRKGGSVDGV